MPRSKQSVELGAILYRYVTGRSGGGGAVPPPPRGAGDRSLRRSTATQVGGLLPRSSSDKKVFLSFCLVYLSCAGRSNKQDLGHIYVYI